MNDFGYMLVCIGFKSEPGRSALRQPETPISMHVAVVHMIPVSDKNESRRKGRKFRNISAAVMNTLSDSLEKTSGESALNESAKSKIIDNPAPIKSSVNVSRITNPMFSPKQKMPMSWYVFNCGCRLRIRPNSTAVCLVARAANVMHRMPSAHPDRCKASGIDKIPSPINTLIELKIVCNRVDFIDTTRMIDSESFDLITRMFAVDSMSSMVPYDGLPWLRHTSSSTSTVSRSFCVSSPVSNGEESPFSKGSLSFPDSSDVDR